ncbi:MAG: hydroxyethylthiazole kinase [Aerococcus sp.]|nr:hydroxyethylthiazole kinase [Aerococcus sp.]
MAYSSIQSLRQKKPVVVNYANFVTPFLVANGLNVIGASPIMSDEAAEADDLVGISQAVSLNAGAVRKESWPLMEALAHAANTRHLPLVLDPVAVGATRYRQNLNRELLAHYSFSAIRGNIGEIAVLAGIDWATRGIDAGEGNSSGKEVAISCATRYHTIAIASGQVDYISDGEKTCAIYNQTDLLPSVVGSGDLLSSMVAAYQGVITDPFEAAVSALLHLNIAGEIASEALDHQYLPGSFAYRLLDALSTLTDEEVTARMKVEVM